MERVLGIPRADFERAYALIVGPDRAARVVAEIFDGLAAQPGDTLVLDDDSLAVLSLVSKDARRLATSAIKPAERLLEIQRALAKKYEAVGAAYPHLLSE